MTEHADKAAVTEEIIEFKPDRVSIVDEGAVGDPYFVVKDKGGVVELPTDDEPSTPIPFHVRKNAQEHLSAVQKRVVFLSKALSDLPDAQLDENATDVSPAVSAEIYKIHDEILAVLDQNVVVEKSIVADSARWQMIQKSVLSSTVRDAIVKILIGISEKLITTTSELGDDNASLETLTYALDRIQYDLRSMAEVAYTLRYLGGEYANDNLGSMTKSKWARKIIGDTKAVENIVETVDNIEKAGKKISTERVQKLKELHKTVKTVRGQIKVIDKELTGILSDVDPVDVKKEKTEMSEENKPVKETPSAETTPVVNVEVPAVDQEAIVKAVSEHVVEKLSGTFEEKLKSLFDKFETAEVGYQEIAKRLERLENAPESAHAGEGDLKNASVAKEAPRSMFKSLFVSDKGDK